MEIQEILPDDTTLDLQAEAWGVHTDMPESLHAKHLPHGGHAHGTIAMTKAEADTVEYIRADLVKEMTRVIVDHYSRLLDLAQEGPGKSGQEHGPPQG